MELMAEQFPGAFAGYRLQVVESHQRSKVDTSGTARAIVQSFQKLGLHFDEVCCMMAQPELNTSRSSQQSVQTPNNDVEAGMNMACIAYRTQSEVRDVLRSLTLLRRRAGPDRAGAGQIAAAGTHGRPGKAPRWPCFPHLQPDQPRRNRVLLVHAQRVRPHNIC